MKKNSKIHHKPRIRLVDQHFRSSNFRRFRLKITFVNTLTEVSSIKFSPRQKIKRHQNPLKNLETKIHFCYFAILTINYKCFWKKNVSAFFENFLFAIHFLTKILLPEPKQKNLILITKLEIKIEVLNLFLPFPKSSSFPWITRQRPTTEFSPAKLINLSVILIFATPDASATTFPKSPTWRISSYQIKNSKFFK